MSNFFINTKAKTFVVLLFSLISLGIFPLSTITASFIFEQWYGIIFGIFLMILATVFHFIGKTHPWGYFISFFINSIANGFSLSALYLSTKIALDFYHLLLGALPAVGILVLVYFMLQIFNTTKRIPITIACILNAFLTIALLVLCVMYGDVLFSFGFFCSLLSFFYLCVFGVTIQHDERLVLRDISFGSFGSFIILTVVVIVILSEGEALDGLDGLELSLDNGKKKKNNL